jgi:hypothetical protein
MKRANEPGEKRRGWPIIGYGAIAIALYVLSSGPAAMMLDKGILPPSLESASEVFYFPLSWLMENTAFDKILGRYIDLWI